MRQIKTSFSLLIFLAGKQIERDPSIDRLIEIRTVLEKIRPIDYKLSYQIDKLVKTAVTGATSVDDPINFKPNLNALTTQLNDGDDDESDDDDDDDESHAVTPSKRGKKSKEPSASAAGIYVPPKLSAVHYDGEDSKAERARKQMERARKRALK